MADDSQLPLPSGKFHLPKISYSGFQNPDIDVISFTEYDFKSETPKLRKTKWSKIYQKQLDYLLKRDKVKTKFKPRQQRNPYTKKPYQPISLDGRFGKPKSTPLTKRVGGVEGVMGRDTIPSEYSASSILGEMGVKAIERLAVDDKPWFLTVSMNSPHPPMVASNDYFSYYSKFSNGIAIPPNFDDALENSAYADFSKKSAGFRNKVKVKKWTALYYALVEEVDSNVGKILDALDRMGATENTIVVFTSDHGEQLAAHSLQVG